MLDEVREHRRIARVQRATCSRHGSRLVFPKYHHNTGISLDPDVRAADIWPLNGLRHPPEHGTTGWYLWRSERFPPEDGGFVPLHTSHLLEELPVVVPFLALEPGWRFLLAPGYEDVWFDESLLRLDD